MCLILNKMYFPVAWCRRKLRIIYPLRLISRGNWRGLCLIWVIVSMVPVKIIRGTWVCRHCLPPNSIDVNFGTSCRRGDWSDHLDVDETQWLSTWATKNLPNSYKGKKGKRIVLGFVSALYSGENEGRRDLVTFFSVSGMCREKGSCQIDRSRSKHQWPWEKDGYSSWQLFKQ